MRVSRVGLGVPAESFVDRSAPSVSSAAMSGLRRQCTEELGFADLQFQLQRPCHGSAVT